MIFTAAEKLKAVEREIAMRRRVYPRWIDNRRMIARRERQRCLREYDRAMEKANRP